MNQDVVFLKIIFYVAMGIFEMRVNVLVFHVFQIDPFMVLYFVGVHFRFNFIVIEGPLVNNGEDAIDA